MRTNFICCFVMFTALTLLLACNEPEQKKEWRLVHTQGAVNFAYINPSYADDRMQIENAIDYICGAKSICRVIFWSDETMIPSSFPITDEQSNNKVAHYQFNANTNYERLAMK